MSPGIVGENSIIDRENFPDREIFPAIPVPPDTSSWQAPMADPEISEPF